MRFTAAVEETFVERMHAAVADMAASIPEVLASSSGRDVSGKPENYDYAIILDFADHAAYERYRVHTAHKALIDAFMKSRAIDKVRIQLEIPSYA